MNTFKLDNQIEHIFILGAGASVDYGLPTWGQLSDLITKKLKDGKQKFPFSDEVELWLEKVGDGKMYKTIDECITAESVSEYFSNSGHEIENTIFSILEEIFKEKYKDNRNGWLRKLNDKILNKEGITENNIAFINYNYDDVLERNFLDYSHLPQKRRIYLLKERLEELSSTNVPALFPHGSFTFNDKYNHISKEVLTQKTNKNYAHNHHDVISCYDSFIFKIKKDVVRHRHVNLYILGLGAGLSVNIGNITIECNIDSVHIVSRSEKNDSVIRELISAHYLIEHNSINFHRSISELIDNTFIDIPF